MTFEELKIKMEAMGFKFEWRDEDVEGIEVDEDTEWRDEDFEWRDDDTDREHEVKVHATGWTVKYPPTPGFWYPVFIPADDRHPQAYLEVMLEKYDRRHDGDEEETRQIKALEKHWATHIVRPT